MKSYKITYRVQEKPRQWSLRYLIVRAYNSQEAKERFTLWEGLITDITEI